MKKISLTILVFVSLTCYSQSNPGDTLRLTISPGVNQKDSLNQQIITTLKLFLKSKDSSNTENKYWAKSDFEKYIYPYFELQDIESGRLGRFFYEPSLMEIIPTNRKNKKIIKLAFIGHNDKTNDNLLRYIYNIVATHEKNNIVFSKYLNYITQSWKGFTEASITYKISPCKKINKGDVIRQKEDITKLCKFLNTKPIPITYYSCTTPKEVFELKGFDYNPMMYIDTSGGFNQAKDIVISGNNSEYYTHEIAHLYMFKLFPSINPFFNEGFATYVGGSGKYGYLWQRNKLEKFLEENPTFQIEEHVGDPFERLYFEHETPVPYVIAALVCERTLRIYGKEKLFDLFRSKKNVFDTLKAVGLTKENINDELRKEIKLPPTLVWQ